MYVSPALGLALASAFTIQAKPAPIPDSTANVYSGTSANPWDLRTVFAPSSYAGKLNQTIAAFTANGDTLSAARARTAQTAGVFTWIANIASLSLIPSVVAEARQAQLKTGRSQMVGLVLYNLPDRDCSAGASSGELTSANNGLQRYKTEYVDVYAAELQKASDISFAVVVEPDSLGNVITNQNIPRCASAAPTYEAGVAYALNKLQLPNVALYMDAAHGGWLGWDSVLDPAAKEFAKVVGMAGNATKIRGFSTNVSNYNPYLAAVRENYTQYSHSWDEYHYTSSLAPYLLKYGLPQHFIVDQGRVALPGARSSWGQWCNVYPTGFGPQPTTVTNSSLVDALVWIKTPGQSDGACGMTGAPAAGQWLEAAAEMLVKNAHSSVKPTYSSQ